MAPCLSGAHGSSVQGDGFLFWISQEVVMLFRVYADPKLKKRIEACWLKQEIEAYIDHLGAVGHRPLFVVEAARQLASFGRYAGPHCDQQRAGLPKLIRPFIKRLNRKGLHLGRGRSTVARFV